MSTIQLRDIPETHLIAWCASFKRRGLSFEVAYTCAMAHPGWANTADMIASNADLNATSIQRFKRLYDAVPQQNLAVNPMRISDLPVATTVDPDRIRVMVHVDDHGEIRQARLRDLFTDDERATLFLVADVLEYRGQADPGHIARLRKVATTIEKLLMFDPPPPT